MSEEEKKEESLRKQTDEQCSVEASAKKRARDPLIKDTSSGVNSNKNSKSLPKPVIIDLAKGRFGTFQPVTSTSASPPSKKTASMQEFIEASDAASNLVLAHEIALDKDFKIPEPVEKTDFQHNNLHSPIENIEKSVKQAMHRAFWDLLEKDLKSEPVRFDHALTLLDEIKETLLSLLPKDRVTTIHKRINEGLDMDLLRQQVKHNALDISKLSLFLIDTMAAMCAPARDKDIESLRSVQDIVPLFKQVYSVLGAMKRDLVNFEIASIRPHIQQQMVEYERDKFSVVLSKLSNGLQATEIWLENVYNEMKEDVNPETNSSNGENSSPSASQDDGQPRITPLIVLKKAYTKLLQWDYKNHKFPETAAVDQTRFNQLQNEFKSLVLLASVVASTLAALGLQLSSHQSYITSLKNDLLALLQPDHISDTELSSTLEGVVEQVWKKTCEYLAEHSYVMLSNDKKVALKAQIENLTGLTSNPIYKVLAKRVSDYLSLVAEYFAREKSPTSPLCPLPVPRGMQVVNTELSVLATNYARLVNLNQTIYGPFYGPVLRKVLGIKQNERSSTLPQSDDAPTQANTSNTNQSKVKKKLVLSGVQSSTSAETEND